ncbi:hypothetical protein [Natrinema pallidum]|uniref:Uncharacterized protein n=1 Tax=Natrinema pallidum DSM 3751 TaxID=1227495 RepID=L9YGN1_9EURY|nr:hypothetical protein [Natrinema pallidum]ELY73254.1 hypothetical protein C487_17670 [Natrinema pallidum DSM 3751]
MSVDHRPTESSGVEQPPRDDPLAQLAEDEVLKCRDPATGWVWFYDVRNGIVRKYHCFHGYAPELVSRTEAAETIARAGDVARVGEQHLAMLRGAGE